MDTHDTQEEAAKIARIAQFHTWAVIAKLPRFRVDEFEDILQSMKARAEYARQQYREGACSVSTFVSRQLEFHSKTLVRHYLAQKRKIFFFQVNQDDDLFQSYVENVATTPLDIATPLDVRQVVEGLSGNKRLLADALLEDAVHDLGWRSNKVYRVKLALAREFKRYGF